ncbi:MAG: ribonuclease J, partial [Clostridia bacterium]|nr:ribonuclease J [Clostridia bacterium]
ALCENKLREHRLMGVAPLNVVEPGDVIEAGEFRVEFIHVNHSIPGACALAIHTPEGVVVHTGDFKVDYTPQDGTPIDFGRLAELGNHGVLALLADSTNVERPGYTMSEKKVAETFNALFERARGRIIIAMFASNVSRIQSVVDSSVRKGRRVCFIGRSMVNVSKVASQLGYLNIPENMLITTDDLDRFPDQEITLVTSGSQGEPMSGLSRMAFAEHRKLEIRESDMVILSATAIPGNEKSVSRVINQLFRIGADVIYESLAEVHVSGHARQEELKLMHSLVRPKFFIPVHGEYRHLHHHANLAISLGMPEDNVVIPEIGDVIELDADSIDVTGVVPSGSVLIDGLGIGDVGAVVLRDRKHLAEDGLLIVVMGVDHDLGSVVSGPDIISRGFVYMREADELLDGAKEAARRAIDAFGPIDTTDWNHVKNDVRESVQRYIYDTIKRNPMILPIIVEI